MGFNRATNLKVESFRL